MSEYFEIAYAAVNKRLCLFTGTGFSKAVTDNEAPSWQVLLENACAKCDNANKLKDSLFPKDGKNPLSLDEAAQVLAIELRKKGLMIHEEIANDIQKLSLKGDNSKIAEFCEKHDFKVITTNYDKLMESICGDAACQSLTPGLPIPRSPARVKVYHVHGSTDVPENMVVTADDYFKFLNSESYFSRKLSTILHENTVVILGYSLGDTNLKAILSDYKGFARNHSIGSSIFLVSRGEIDRHIKDYYSNCYGIRVIDLTEVVPFFGSLNAAIPSATDCVESSLNNIKKVVFDRHKFTDKFLSLENSFYEIVSSVSAIGLSINDSRVVAMLGKIIEVKSRLSLANGAWDQYTQLARWLVYLASILDLEKTSIQEIFLEAVKSSMNSMSKELKLGYSWHAYKSWNARWDSITPSNRTLIRDYILAKTTWPDAVSVVSIS